MASASWKGNGSSQVLEMDASSSAAKSESREWISCPTLAFSDIRFNDSNGHGSKPRTPSEHPPK